MATRPALQPSSVESQEQKSGLWNIEETRKIQIRGVKELVESTNLPMIGRDWEVYWSSKGKEIRNPRNRSLPSREEARPLI
jgi:hypothetical protein